MADRIPGGNNEGFVALSAACARVYRAVTGRASGDLDAVALSLCMVARIYATDPLTKLLFPINEAELVRGRFQGGGAQFARDGEVRYTDLYVALADLEDAIRLLAGARMQHPPEPPPTRP
jgi:hypothetical protein